MTRAQNKRLQHLVYDYLTVKSPLTSHQITDWYNHERRNTSRHSQGAGHGTSVRDLSAILSKCLLFENTTEGWVARPIVEVVRRAVASKRPVKKFPAFLQKEINLYADRKSGVYDEK